MEILTLILNALPYIIVAIVLIGGAIAFFKGQKKSLKDILLYLCTEAEKMFGSKTGQLKLKYTWAQACQQFPFLTTFLSFDKFSKMVDNCLVDMKHLVETNESIAEYVGVEKKDNVKGEE